MVYFRVVDEAGRPIPDATFSPPLTTVPSRTDSYGRWQSLFQGSHDITFTAKGFSPATLHIECQQDEEIDRQVVMRK